MQIERQHYIICIKQNPMALAVYAAESRRLAVYLCSAKAPHMTAVQIDTMRTCLLSLTA